jgi:hypothetical protein
MTGLGDLSPSGRGAVAQQARRGAVWGRRSERGRCARTTAPWRSLCSWRLGGNSGSALLGALGVLARHERQERRGRACSRVTAKAPRGREPAKVQARAPARASVRWRSATGPRPLASREPRSRYEIRIGRHASPSRRSLTQWPRCNLGRGMTGLGDLSPSGRGAVAQQARRGAVWGRRSERGRCARTTAPWRSLCLWRLGGNSGSALLGALGVLGGENLRVSARARRARDEAFRRAATASRSNSTRAKVDLPAPEPPSSTTTSPGAIVRSAPSMRTRPSGRATRSPRTASAGVSIPHQKVAETHQHPRGCIVKTRNRVRRSLSQFTTATTAAQHRVGAMRLAREGISHVSDVSHLSW